MLDASALPDGTAASRLHLACVQQELRAEDYGSEAAFQARLERWMTAIRRRVGPGEPLLVAFPEDVGTFMVFFGHGDILRSARSLPEAISALIRRHRAEVLWRRLRCRAGWVRALALALGDQVRQAYRRLFSEAARRYRAFVVAGSAVLPAPYRPCETANLCYVFGPNGELLGWQPKTHLTPIEGPAQLDIAPAPLEELRVIPTSIGRLGVAICLDAFQEPVLERLTAAGADILVQPSANPGPWTPEQQADWKRSAWTAVRRWPQLRWGLNPMMVGELLGLRFEGQSSIVTARSELWQPGGYEALGEEGGFVAVAPSATQEALLVATVPLTPAPERPRAGRR
ncbi:MAG TPA: nitrilase-related carbon-nitrogen hydrolase [Limnochordales bacterium]